MRPGILRCGVMQPHAAQRLLRCMSPGFRGLRLSLAHAADRERRGLKEKCPRCACLARRDSYLAGGSKTSKPAACQKPGS